MMMLTSGTSDLTHYVMPLKLWTISIIIPIIAHGNLNLETRMIIAQ